MLTLVSEHLPQEREIRVRVIDSGCGIPEAQIGRIFEPFFTSKASGKGTGLGLYICYEIMRMHDGRLRVDSKVEEGTSFELCLPITKRA